MSTPTDDLALLVLEDGTVHRGRAYGCLLYTSDAADE